MTFAGLYFVDSINKNVKYNHRRAWRNSIAITGMVGLTAFRIIEIFDIFTHYSLKITVFNKKFDSKFKNSFRLFMAPYVAKNSPGIEIAYNINF